MTSISIAFTHTKKNHFFISDLAYHKLLCPKLRTLFLTLPPPPAHHLHNRKSFQFHEVNVVLPLNEAVDLKKIIKNTIEI